MGGSDATMNRKAPATTVAGLLRAVWAGLSILLLESLLFGVSIAPATLGWLWLLEQTPAPHWLAVTLMGIAFVPAYLVFAFIFLTLSALATGVLGWRAPRDASMRIADLEWPLLDWARYNISIHMVRTLTGPFLRTTPLWNFYMRLNGARLGRRVWVNSLWLTDHNLLDFGDGVVIGSEAHLSGHTVERGVVRTAPVRLGDGVVVGLSTHVEIGVEVGAGCQIGSLSMVPKFTKLDPHGTYVGAPVHKLEEPLPGGEPW